MKHATAISQLARLVLRPSQWTPEFTKMAACLPTDAPGVNAAWLAEQVRSGLSRVVSIELATPDKASRPGRLGFVVFCVTPSHELVVQAAYSEEGESILTGLADHFEKLARRFDCDTVRFHTMRPGLVASAQKLGYRVSEIIMRKALA